MSSSASLLQFEGRHFEFYHEWVTGKWLTLNKVFLMRHRAMIYLLNGGVEHHIFLIHLRIEDFNQDDMIIFFISIRLLNILFASVYQ